MSFARRLFNLAGIYGLIVILPQYFLEARIGRDYPPPITHPENFYGFIGVTAAFQVLFLIIAKDPVRYRMAMLPGMLEKVTFAGAVGILYLQGRVATAVLPFAVIDLTLATLFLVAFRRTAEPAVT